MRRITGKLALASQHLAEYASVGVLELAKVERFGTNRKDWLSV